MTFSSCEWRTAALARLFNDPAVFAERHIEGIVVLGEPHVDSTGTEISVTGLLVYR